MAVFNGYYINLDRSPERRDHMEAEAQRLGIDWLQRFPAVDGRELTPGPDCALSKGGLACFLSHLQIIETTPADGYTFIFEDDVQFSLDLPLALGLIDEGILESYDLVLLDCQPNLAVEVLSTLWVCLKERCIDPRFLEDFAAERRIHSLALYDPAGVYAWGISSYLVTPRGHASLPPLMRDCLDRGPPGQWDLLVRDACRDGRIKAAVIAPFLATPLLDSYADTTIDNRAQDDFKMRTASAVRRMFFAGPVSGVEPYAARLFDSALAPVALRAPNRLMPQLVARVFDVLVEQKGFTL
jgi:hypothetical protein